MKASYIIGKIVIWTGWALLLAGIALAIEGEILTLEAALTVSGAGIVLVLAGEAMVVLFEIEANTRAGAATLKRIESRLGDMGLAVRQAAAARETPANVRPPSSGDDIPPPASRRKST